VAKTILDVPAGQRHRRGSKAGFARKGIAIVTRLERTDVAKTTERGAEGRFGGRRSEGGHG
jgi:hypothetical protein